MRLGGLTEVAEVLGVSRQRVTQLRQLEEFPEPVGTVAQGAIWDLDEVARWGGSDLRRVTPGRPSKLATRRTLGKRFLLEEDSIGSGGFADVFRALDRRTGETVAVKVLRNLGDIAPEAVRRFARELRLMKDIDHPNVMPVLAEGELTDQDAIWFAMPLASGSLGDYIESVAGNATLIVDILGQVNEGLEHIHREGIVHRDLKPANILLRESGVWAVSDFGLASEVERNTTVLTSTLRAGLGSFWYTAPEQWTNARDADARSDVYSLGKVMQHLVTGEAPVTAEMPAHVLRPVVERATASKPDRRYQSVREFSDAMKRALTTTTQIRLWTDADEAANLMYARVTSPATPLGEISQVLRWAEGLDERDDDQMKLLAKVLAGMNEQQLAFVFETDKASFLRVLDRFGDYVSRGGFDFDYCDVLAAFGRRSFDATKDPQVLGIVLSYLVALGPGHNRWYVRDVVVKILGQLREEELLVAAVEALLAAPRSNVRWSITDFAMRSLPHSIRAAVEPAIAEVS